MENIQVNGRGYVQVMDGLRYPMAPGGEAVVDYRLQPGEVLAGTIDPLINGIAQAVFYAARLPRSVPRANRALAILPCSTWLHSYGTK